MILLKQGEGEIHRAGPISIQAEQDARALCSSIWGNRSSRGRPLRWLVSLAVTALYLSQDIVYPYFAKEPGAD